MGWEDVNEAIEGKGKRCWSKGSNTKNKHRHGSEFYSNCWT